MGKTVFEVFDVGLRQLMELSCNRCEDICRLANVRHGVYVPEGVRVGDFLVVTCSVRFGGVMRTLGTRVFRTEEDACEHAEWQERSWSYLNLINVRSGHEVEVWHVVPDEELTCWQHPRVTEDMESLLLLIESGELSGDIRPASGCSGLAWHACGLCYASIAYRQTAHRQGVWDRAERARLDALLDLALCGSVIPF